MTYSEKLALAAECRKGTALDTGLPPESRATVRELHEPAYLPGGYEKSMVPEPPPAEDLSHLNSPSWRKSQAVGRRNGGKWRKAKE